MPLHETKTPPAEEGDGGLRTRPTGVSSTSIAGHSAGNKSRSIGHPCWYRAGRAGDCDVYWHPVVGVAIEIDHAHLVDYTGPVEYFVDPDDYRHLAEDVAINRNLIDAMPEDLLLAYIAKYDEAQARAAADWADTQVKDEMRTATTELW